MPDESRVQVLNQPAARHVGGPTLWFVTPSETIEITMADGSFETAVSAAQTLDARFYVSCHNVWKNDAQGTTHTGFEWRVFDTRHVQRTPVYAPNGVTIGKKWIITPAKIFRSDTIDPAVMWALAKGAQG